MVFTMLFMKTVPLQLKENMNLINQSVSGQNITIQERRKGKLNMKNQLLILVNHLLVRNGI